MGVTVVPATAERFDDAAAVLNPTGAPAACWCLSWRPAAGGAGDRPEQLRRLAASDTAPGMLAYVDDGAGPVAAGWLGFARRSDVTRLQRSRVLPNGDPATWASTWVVWCFVVRVGFRRRGIARELLRGAVAHVRDAGGTAVEGFPIDPAGRAPGGAAFVGTVDLFSSAGFEVVGPTSGHSGRMPRWHVRLDL